MCHACRSQGERPPLPRDVGYLLHALRAELAHPTSGERLVLYAAPPSQLCDDGEAPFVEEGGGATVDAEQQCESDDTNGGVSGDATERGEQVGRRASPVPDRDDAEAAPRKQPKTA